jgi:hypothetical protein
MKVFSFLEVIVVGVHANLCIVSCWYEEREYCRSVEAESNRLSMRGTGWRCCMVCMYKKRQSMRIWQGAVRFHNE